MAHVEQAGAGSDGHVLVHDAGILDRHFPSAEGNHPGAHLAMLRVKGRFFELVGRRLVHVYEGVEGRRVRAVWQRVRACTEKVLCRPGWVKPTDVVRSPWQTAPLAFKCRDRRGGEWRCHDGTARRQSQASVWQE